MISRDITQCIALNQHHSCCCDNASVVSIETAQQCTISLSSYQVLGHVDQLPLCLHCVLAYLSVSQDSSCNGPGDITLLAAL